MCLYIDPVLTKSYQSRPSRIRAWKVLECVDGEWVTPYQRTPMEPVGTHEAGGELNIEPISSTSAPDKHVLFGGAIHCYLSGAQSLDWLPLRFQDQIFEVWIEPEDVIGAGHGQIAAKKITFCEGAES